METRKIIEIAREHGFEPRKRGATNHVVWIKKGSRNVAIPVSKKEIPIGTAKQILKALGVKN